MKISVYFSYFQKEIHIKYKSTSSYMAHQTKVLRWGFMLSYCAISDTVLKIAILK